MKLAKSLVAAALAVASISSFASIVVQAPTSFAAGVHSQSTAIGTFTAWNGASTSTFGYKAAQGGYQGVGVSAGDKGEINISERIDAALNQAYVISQFTLGLLFNGPEYNDVFETAKVSVKFDGSSSFTDYFLTTTKSDTEATWSGSFGSVVNRSPAVSTAGGVWSVLNPFGTQKITDISWTAVAGSPGTVGGGNSNQSDFTLVSVTAVPEVETYAMMLAGLGLMGTITRRRNKAKTA